MEFSRPEYWSGQPFPSPEDLPNPAIKPRSPALQVDSLPAEPQGTPTWQTEMEGKENKHTLSEHVCQLLLVSFCFEHKDLFSNSTQTPAGLGQARLVTGPEVSGEPGPHPRRLPGKETLAQAARPKLQASVVARWPPGPVPWPAAATPEGEGGGGGRELN